ncbi:MAG: radical SAM family heme chaperone HemW [Rhodoferax sp.]
MAQTRPGDEATEPILPHDIQHYMRAGTLQFQAPPPLSLYVHLPWCLKKCPYCDFNSHAVAPGALPEADYIAALMADLESALPLVWGRSVHTVFIGGGTPSLFSPQGIDALLAGVRARLPLAADAEITLEANPGTFEKERFRAYRNAGVTRLSVGVQSFNDAHLRALGRVHNGEQAQAALAEAATVFESFNLDLMYALPGQSLADLRADLSTALSFGPPHLSVYHLTVEPNTLFAKYPPAPVDDDLAAEMLDTITATTAQAGLARYEVSAYARAGHACRHNLNYWQFGDYLGIGAGAHSKLSFAHRVVRQVRLRDPARYMAAARAGSGLASEVEVKRADLVFEFMLNALRLADGFALEWFTQRTGLPLSALGSGLQTAQQRGWLVLDDARVRPTARGFDFLSDVQALFLPDAR